MKVGDYVRTKNKIGKIIKCNSIYFILDNDADNIAHEQDEIVKSSPNIIDLIEVGDYVNGSKVVNTNLIPEVPIYRFVIVDTVKKNTLYSYDIKSIVTKEQFENMEYKVGE